MRELVERRLADGRVRDEPGGRRVQVNLRESPLDWLKSRSLVDARQYEAGERLRGDYERAALGPRVTMRWDAAPRGGKGKAIPAPARLRCLGRHRYTWSPAHTGRRPPPNPRPPTQ